MRELKEMGKKAKEAAFAMNRATTEKKNALLKALIQQIKKDQKKILQANQEDIEAGLANGLTETLIDRLSLQGRLEGILQDVEQVIKLPDHVGEIFDQQKLPNNLTACKYRTPIGVLGVIYESRPNVTIDVAALALKSGNCAILRGGSETLRSNLVLVEAIQKALKDVSLPEEAIQIIPSVERSLVQELLRLHEYVDLIIPRGSNTLQKFCRENSSIPVITGGIGICHLFVDESADLEKSLQVIENAKTQRPTVCNALDTTLVHAGIAKAFVPKIIAALSSKKVSFRLDEHALKIMQKSPHPSCKEAGPHDWDTEWLSLVLGIKVLQNLDEAIAHIQRHSSGHSDGILTENKAHADLFVKVIDSAAVYVNASTRFTDGAQLGLGAEVAISTQKLHARGPMGLKELTSYKWVMHGDYEVRS